MAIEIKLHTQLGELSRRVHPPEGELDAAELTPLFYHLADALVGQVLDEAKKQNLAISCKAGCGACCSQMVPISEPEIFAIARLVQNLPEPRQSEIRDRFARARERLEEAELLDNLASPPEDPAGVLDLMYRYFQAGIPCPFLEEGSCGIHAERPTICREYNVISDPILCTDPINNTIRTLAAPVYLSNIIARTLTKLCGYRTKITPLTLALDWAEERPERGRVRFQPLEVIKTFIETFQETIDENASDSPEIFTV